MVTAHNWVPYQSPLGFVITHPSGWSVDADNAERILVCNPDRSVFVFIHPFLLPQPASSLAWLQQVPALFPALFPQARLLKAQPYRTLPDESCASLLFSGSAGIGQANLLCSLHERSGMFY